MTRTNGLTLVEFLIATAIIGVLLTAGIPSFATLIASQRTATIASSLLHDLQAARTDAVLKQQTICIASINGNWQEGWQAFDDGNRNCALDASERELLHRSAIADQVRVAATHTLRQHIIYVPSGQSEQLNGAFLAGSIYVCPQHMEGDAYRIVVSRSGRIRSEHIAATASGCSS